jgi:threonine dehydrogenase-like Zn-dependent dehydrogenase
VVGEINLACCQPAECTACKKGGVVARNHCGNRAVLGILTKDGTYAEFLTLPVRNLHVVPATVSTENAAFVEPLAAALRIREQQVVRPGDKVCVVGDGKLGLLCAITLARDGCHPVLIGRHTEKMALATNAEAVLASDALPKYAGAFDVVVDATGNPEGLQLSQQLCAPLGTLVLKSTCAAGTTFNTAPYVIDELKIIVRIDLVHSAPSPFSPRRSRVSTLRFHQQCWPLSRIIHPHFSSRSRLQVFVTV